MSRMQAAYIKEHGGPEKIEFGELPEPKLKQGEVVVRVRACALNHLDIWVRNGIPAYKTKFPHILGSDIAGEIAEIHSNEKIPLPPPLQKGEKGGLEVGSPVFVAPGISCWNCAECLSGHDNQCATFKIIGAGRDGGYAEYVSVPAANIFPKPEHLSFEDCASFPLTFLTAWHMLITRARLQPGERVLVLGAGSGVGAAAIQIAKLAGAVVFAVSSSDAKLVRAKEIGADITINGSKEDFSKKVRELTKGKGVEIVFEHIGPATWEQSMRSLAPRGRLVTCGATSGPEVQLDLRFLFTKDFSILGSKMGTRSELEKIVRLIEEKRLHPIVSKVFPLKEACEAHRFMENREQFGKIVLKI